MKRRTYLGILCGMWILAQACKGDHRMGHRARGEVEAKKDSIANANGGSAPAGGGYGSTGGGNGPAGGDSLAAAALVTDYPASMKDVASEYRSEVAGIDISHWDGEIDWALLDQQNIYFVYMKATEGESYVDPTFAANWAAIKRTSLRRGAYLFFDPGLSGEAQKAQALNFILTVKSFEQGDLPPMLDVEDDPEVPVQTFQSRLLTVIGEIQSHFHVQPIIYTTGGLYEKYMNKPDNFRPYQMWIAEYAYRRRQLCDKKEVRIWQFTDNAKMKGIHSPVDMDIFYTTPEDLEDLVMGK